jgi:hypothetical protein
MSLFVVTRALIVHLRSGVVSVRRLEQKEGKEGKEGREGREEGRDKGTHLFWYGLKLSIGYTGLPAKFAFPLAAADPPPPPWFLFAALVLLALLPPTGLAGAGAGAETEGLTSSEVEAVAEAVVLPVGGRPASTETGEPILSGAMERASTERMMTMLCAVETCSYYQSLPGLIVKREEKNEEVGRTDDSERC